MNKRILSFLCVGIIGYSLGTLSIVHADGNTQGDASAKKLKELESKVDQVLKNQEEILSQLKKMWTRL